MVNQGGKARYKSTRLRLQSGLCGLMVLGLVGGHAFAQTATQLAAPVVPPAKTPPAKPDPKATADQDKTTADANASGDSATITVTGQKPLNRIDRQTYDNTKDPDSKTGTALDALAKVPGVSVDPSGVVTLRGKEPTILINGRPAPQLQGDNRAAALQSMASGSITSVEVMNNPGAQYGTGNSASVLNLITTTVLPPGGYLSAQVRSTDGESINGSGHFQIGKLSVNGSLYGGSDKQISRSGSSRRSLDAGGNILRSTQGNSLSRSDNNNVNASVNFDYRLSRKDTLSAGLTYFAFGNTGHNHGNSVYYSPAGVATDIYTSVGQNHFDNANQMGSLTWSHTGQKPGETLKVDWRVTQTLGTNDFSNLSAYSLSAIPSNLAGYQSHSSGKTKTTNNTFSIDYNVPLGYDQFSTGFQLVTDDSKAPSQFSAPNAIIALSNSEFDYSQSVSAFYATYQKPIGDHWTVLGGLRIELFDLDGASPLVGLRSHASSTTYNPSLFATYVISDKAKFRLNYSHRLQRPYAFYYNPQTVQTSLTSITAGQARLKPQNTDSYEAGYEYANKGTSYQLRGYYTRETGIIIDIANFVPDPLNLGNLVLRTSRANAGTRDTVGSEFNFNGKLTPKLSMNLNANLSDVSLDTPNFKGTKSISGLQGRIGLTYTVSANDTALFNYTISPRMLSTQGYRTGYGQVGLQYSHKFSQTLRLTAVASDLGRSSKTTNFTTTPTVEGISFYSRQAPTFYISLSKTFGGTPSASSGGASRTVIVGPGGMITSGGPAGAATPTGGTIIRY